VSRHRLLKTVNERGETESWPQTPERRRIASWVLHGPKRRVSRHRLLKTVNRRGETESWPRTPERRRIASWVLHGVYECVRHVSVGMQTHDKLNND
jgi:hypothetical protein